MRTVMIALAASLTLATQTRSSEPAYRQTEIVTGERDGRWFASTRVSSPGAAGLQFFLEELRLPRGARLTLYSANASGGPPEARAAYQGAGPAAGDGFWTTPVPGEEVLLEVLYEDVVSAGLPFRIGGVRVPEPHEITRVVDPAPAPSSDPVETGYALYRGAVVPYQVHDGVALFEGDIILGPAGRIEPADPKATGQRQSIGISANSSRWKNGTMPYEIDPSLPNPSRVTSAIDSWNSQLGGALQLVPHTTESAWVRFVPSSGCASHVGSTGQAGQQINIAEWCAQGHILHEIGHAAGLFHEQSREDRDRHIRILWENMAKDSGPNFSQFVSSSDDIGPYDYGSIMHYPETAYSINGEPTIVTIPPGIPIGQRSGLSPGDQGGVEAIYRRSDPPPPTEPVSPPQPPPGPPAPPPPQPSLVQVTLTSNPVGRPLVVDGQTVVTPATVSWSMGSLHTVSAPANETDGVRYKFAYWSDGGAETHTVTAPGAYTILTATFAMQYRITVASSNPSLGWASLSSYSPDSYFDQGSTVTVRATGYNSACLTGWSGISAPPASPLQVTVNRAYAIVANFQTGAVTLAPSQLSLPWYGGTIAAGVTASTSCAWTATTGSNWIKILEGAGVRSGVIRFSAPWNFFRSPRTGTIQVGNSTITIYQAGF